MDIQAKRGDHEDYDLALTDRNQNPVNLTGCTVWFMAKRRPTDEDVDAIISKESGAAGLAVLDAVGGTLLLTLEPGDTEDLADGIQRLYYDVQVKDATGRITTPLEGHLDVDSDIRRAVI